MKKLLKVGEPYESNGEKKIAYKTIGEIFTARSGKEYAKLYFMPGVLISVFEEEKKPSTSKNELQPDEDINF